MSFSIFFTNRPNILLGILNVVGDSKISTLSVKWLSLSVPIREPLNERLLQNLGIF